MESINTSDSHVSWTGDCYYLDDSYRGQEMRDESKKGGECRPAHAELKTVLIISCITKL